MSDSLQSRSLESRTEETVVAQEAARERIMDNYGWHDSTCEMGPSGGVACTCWLGRDLDAYAEAIRADLCICGHGRAAHIHDDEGHDWCGYAGQPGCYLDDGIMSDYDGAEHPFLPLGRVRTEERERARTRDAEVARLVENLSEMLRVSRRAIAWLERLVTKVDPNDTENGLPVIRAFWGRLEAAERALDSFTARGGDDA